MNSIKGTIRTFVAANLCNDTRGLVACVSTITSSSSSHSCVSSTTSGKRIQQYKKYSTRITLPPQHAHTHSARIQTFMTTNNNNYTAHTLLSKRYLAIKTKAKNRSNINANNKPTPPNNRPSNAQTQQQQQQYPINEHLIRMLLEKNNSSATADDIQIRLILDQGRDEKPLIEIMSLTDAIKISSEKGLDLVGIQVKNQDIPVVKCVDFQKYLYQQNKKGSGGSSGGGGGGSGGGGNKTTKQFSFKAGIDNDDLERKAKNMVSYLVKGHSCQVTITSSRRNLKNDSDVIMTTLERLKEIIGGDGNPQGNIKKNEWGNRGTLLFQPVSRKN